MNICILHSILKSICILYLIHIFSVYTVYCTKLKMYNILLFVPFPKKGGSLMAASD